MIKQVTKHPEVDKDLEVGRGDEKFSIVCDDIGNQTMIMISSEATVVLPHAFSVMDKADYADEGDEGLEDENTFMVNGVPYLLRETVVKEGKGAVKFGSARYEPDYIGVINAILMFLAFEKSRDNVYVMANHPPKDKGFRRDIQEALSGKWIVSNSGKKKSFYIDPENGVGCYHEPEGGLNRRLLTPDGLKFREDSAELREGRVVLCDVGGFTTDFTVVNNGIPDTDNSKSLIYGMLDVMRNFEKAVRHNNRSIFKHLQYVPQFIWREAFKTGIFNAGDFGEIDVTNEAKKAGGLGVDEIFGFITTELGGMGLFGAMMLGGGGGSQKALGQFVPERLNKAKLYHAHDDADFAHLSNAEGAVRRVKMLKHRNALRKKKSTESAHKKLQQTAETTQPKRALNIPKKR